MAATAASGEKARNQRRFTVARAELEQLLGAASALVEKERARDSSNGTIARMAGDLERARERCAGRTFRVAVLGLLKAGKSTLINALLGRDLLPSSNVPETARVVRVEHTAGEAAGALRVGGRVVARGDADIRDYLCQQNARARGPSRASAKGDLVLSAEIAALGDRPLAHHGFELVDTPGPDEAGVDGLAELVDRALIDADAVIYLLDYTKLRTVEERRLLDRLAALRPELVRRLSERLFFAVNKIDLENHHGLSSGDLRDYVVRLLRAEVPGLEVDAGRVLLMSAEHALLARLVSGGAAGSGALRDFSRLCFGLRAPREPTLAACARHADAVLEGSGLPEVEERVVSFVYERRGELFVSGQLDELERHLANLDNQLLTGRRVLLFEHDELVERRTALEAELAAGERDFATVESGASALAQQLEAWVAERFAGFRDQVQAELTEAFSAGGGDDAEVWRPVTTLLAGGALDQEVADEVSLHRRIAELHLAVATALRARFATFWGDLELAAWDRQREMLSEVEAQAAALGDRTGAEAGRQLGIALRPVRLAIPTPTFEDLHAALAQQLQTLVERRSRSVDERATRRVRVRSGGWCTEEAYEQRAIGVVRRVTTFACDRGAMLEHWRAWIRERTAVSIATGRAAVQARVGAAVGEARALLADQRDGYRRTVERALGESRHGEIERRRRAEEIERARIELAELLDRVARCREFLSHEGDGERTGAREKR